MATLTYCYSPNHFHFRETVGKAVCQEPHKSRNWKGITGEELLDPEVICDKVELGWECGRRGTPEGLERSRVCSLLAKCSHVIDTHHLEVLSVFSSLLSMSHLKFYCFISLLF